MTRESPMVSQVRFIFILAMPRTGSSHLTRLLRSCGAFNVKSEVFHKTGINLQEDEVAALTELAAGAIADPATLRTWRADHPRQTLETLFRIGGDRPVIVKLFAGHLKRPRVTEVFSRDDAIYLVLKRRPIESFISNLKAKSVGKFGALDTTSIKPALDAPEFVQSAKRTKRWYDWLDSELPARNLPWAPVSYERELDGRPEEEALADVLRKLESLGLPAMKMPRRIISGVRQDKEPDYRNRVANWQEFEATLRATPEHAALLEWAQTVR